METMGGQVGIKLVPEAVQQPFLLVDEGQQRGHSGRFSQEAQGLGKGFAVHGRHSVK